MLFNSKYYDTAMPKSSICKWCILEILLEDPSGLSPKHVADKIRKDKKINISTALVRNQLGVLKDTNLVLMRNFFDSLNVNRYFISEDGKKELENFLNSESSHILSPNILSKFFK